MRAVDFIWYLGESPKGAPEKEAGVMTIPWVKKLAGRKRGKELRGRARSSE
jgi:hypothetical protein